VKEGYERGGVSIEGKALTYEEKEGLRYMFNKRSRIWKGGGVEVNGKIEEENSPEIFILFKIIQDAKRGRGRCRV